MDTIIHQLATQISITATRSSLKFQGTGLNFLDQVMMSSPAQHGCDSLDKQGWVITIHTIRGVQTFLATFSPIITAGTLHSLDYLEVGIRDECILDGIHAINVLEVDTQRSGTLEETNYLEHAFVTAVHGRVEVLHVTFTDVVHWRLARGIGNTGHCWVSLEEVRNHIRRGGPLGSHMDGIPSGNIRACQADGIQTGKHRDNTEGSLESCCKVHDDVGSDGVR